MDFLIIDGNSLINKAYYGIRPLSNKKGVFTHAILGFFNIYLKLVKKYEPKYLAVAFDMRAPTFRKEIYQEYKATRKGMPEDLAIQFPYIKEILNSMGIKILEKEGYEADDILGTLSRIAENSGKTCIIATGDRDSFQLVTDKVWVNLAKTNQDIIYKPETIHEQYGISPKNMIDLKALMGDSSDNIPGVPGVGEKTALALIQAYKSVDYIYENINTIDIKETVKKKLVTGKDLCFMSKELGEIFLEVDISNDVSDYLPVETDKDKLSSVLSELEMYSLLEKFNLMPVKAIVENNPIEEELKTAIIIEYNNEIFVHKNNKLIKIEGEELNEFLSNDEPKSTFNIKQLWNSAFRNNTEIKNVVFDITLAAYLLNVNQTDYTFEKLCAENGIDFDDNLESLSICLPELNSRLYRQVKKEKLLDILQNIEIPLSEVLVDMEIRGVKLDKEGVKKFGDNLQEEILILEEKIYQVSGYKFNISSPKQLGEILFEKLMLPSGKKTKTGYSTNAEVLDYLMDKHEVIPLISEYRAVMKLNSTYVQGLLKSVSENGRIHSTFKQTETRTGRISSVEPNIQNIPVRTTRGKEMRKFFVSKNGYKLIDADYSQIELRILAHMSSDDIMKNAFINNDDIHAITAEQVFGDKGMRSAAKAVNFGIVYGIGAFSLSKDIGVSVAEADRYIKSYLAKYKGVEQYMDETIKKAKTDGYVSTMFGRKRYILEIKSTNKNTQAAGKRIAMNSPIQGSAADMIKLAMISVYNELKNSNLKAHLILQVHDELIIEAAENDADSASAILKKVMENVVELSVPVVVDVNKGDNWFETH